MGVPALFRWLSKKYPKIVLPVIEDTPVSVPGPDGQMDELPIDTSGANPNGEEFDNLYLDMNGIVHPCTHPDGKPAPKTEQDMMHEVFLYTERVVAMVRPRKLLMMAIDGVAPRAKMNQQRSRRFRSAAEAKVKEEERIKAIEEWEAMGKEVSDEMRGGKGWDSNAITPGTPFMDLLAKSLRYWVAKKLNEDPGWAGLQVIISDASVPGEGEHKIMDFIRRQRSHSSHDPNTKHVIYGLDADLIMLSLATHEPYFRVLREDVFAQDSKKPRGCHTCGQPGHHSSQCTGKPKDPPLEGRADQLVKPSPLKPFIFLDVSILREYLAVELSAPVHSFPFDLERAIDDWVFLIFFVGNDFLPHLPSLEIREGAIDTLMTIWKNSLEPMGGYLAQHGKVNLERAQLILEQLASREDEIFRKRREAEERQDRNEKRRKLENDQRNHGKGGQASGQVGVNWQMQREQDQMKGMSQAALSNGLSDYGQHKDLSSNGGLPPKPTWVDPSSLPAPSKGDVASMVGSNASIVANRKAIRMANLSARDMIKAEMQASNGGTEETQKERSGWPTASKQNSSAAELLKKQMMGGDEEEETEQEVEAEAEKADEENGRMAATEPEAVDEKKDEAPQIDGEASAIDVDVDASEASPRGTKRKVEDVEPESAEVTDLEDDGEDDDESSEDTSIVVPGGVHKVKVAPLKHMGNNVVEQDDMVKLWEPGYKERYYRQKFGVELSDLEFRKSIVKSYVEGLCWVLEYYYQGTPSWQWYYPHHFSPFASDFVDLKDLDINFTLGQPFRPYEQLMGVFPAASRFHLPEPFQPLMTESDSPIIDFYPEEFEVDMNGKKMLWQGVALLPFIDPDRLLTAMGTKYPLLSDFENHRNQMGHDSLFVMQEHPLYDYLEGLYTKRRIQEPVALDTKRSKGLAGLVLPESTCIPGAIYDSPLPSLPDIQSDRSISAEYKFPEQKTPHRSILLPGVKVARPVLSQHDRDGVRRGGGEQRYEGNNGFHAQRRNEQTGPGFHKRDQGQRGQQGYQQGGYQQGGGGGGGYQQQQRPGGYQGQTQQGGYGGYGGAQGYYAQQPVAAGYGGYQPPVAQPSYGGYQPPPQAGGVYGGRGGAPPAPAGYYPPPPIARPQTTYAALPPGMGSAYGGARPAPNAAYQGYQPPAHGRGPPGAPPAAAAYGGYGVSAPPPPGAASGWRPGQPPRR
ncbi:BZ3500_MvSof-1268-A1-R1_Chr7-3g09627 [Microbotryum saponariae]|uniref:5'-3' exoribonuclease n=1 Tax=Microbotryum saponariae TaxID=289078 RepID=A0A2X0M022_9BASI|nr:BZ3500_MvSof-1268-A1-R1_Chr7-3g09627 [Microbotryum saponariae]